MINSPNLSQTIPGQFVNSLNNSRNITEILNEIENIPF